MAQTIRPIEPVQHTGQVPLFGDFQLEKDGKINTITASYIITTLKAITKVLNGGLCFGVGSSATRVGNFNAQWIDVTFGPADTEVEIPHGLMRVPIAYEVVRADRACIVYDSSAGSWSDAWLMLKCNVANATVKLKLY